ncbi:Uncharacterised protein [Mycobacteroides abscessus subsp. massiliense]|nr:Uncharacterised protein [Mycobacteroides abscessus subsp. massiliense]
MAPHRGHQQLPDLPIREVGGAQDVPAPVVPLGHRRGDTHDEIASRAHRGSAGRHDTQQALAGRDQQPLPRASGPRSRREHGGGVDHHHVQTSFDEVQHQPLTRTLGRRVHVIQHRIAWVEVFVGHHTVGRVPNGRGGRHVHHALHTVPQRGAGHVIAA